MNSTTLRPRTRIARVLAATAVAAVGFATLATAPADARTPARVSSAAPKLWTVKGYKYITAPSTFSSFTTSLLSTGYISGAVIKGADNGKDQEVIMLAQYKPTLTKSLDKMSNAQVLNAASSGVLAVSKTAKPKDYAVAGTHVRAVSIGGMAMVFAYIKSGKLIEIFGPTIKGAVNFAKLYLVAAKAHGQKLG